MYLADPAIAPSVLPKGKSLLEDDLGLGRAVETAFFKHVLTRYYGRSIGFSYWRGKGNREVDIIADLGDRRVPFEVKYRGPNHTRSADLKGLTEFCLQEKVDVAYVITRELTDFRVMSLGDGSATARALKVPAALACYWLGRSELESAGEPRA